MKICIVTTLYHSAGYLDEFYNRCLQSVKNIGSDYEFVLVNDGSPDNSVEVALRLRELDSRVRIVDLSRNFGHHRAMMIGLSYATGDLVFLIDCDLEEPPECLLDLYNAMQQEGADVIYGVQGIRSEPWLSKLSARIYYRLLTQIADVKITPHLLTARLMTIQYVKSLVQHQERVFNIESLWQRTGYTQKSILINKSPHKGASTYNLRRRLALAFTSIISTSNKPLIAIALLGITLMIPSFLGIIILIARYFLLGAGAEGWASLMVSICFSSGLVIFTTGVMALYIAVIFEEVKARPYAIVRQVYENTDHRNVDEETKA